MRFCVNSPESQAIWSIIMPEYIKVLTIAGSDSGGGAGIQADLKTISALGAYGMSVITALTAQNTLGVSAVHAPPASFTGEQLDAVFSDMGADAIKIGMVFSAEIAGIVAQKLRQYEARNIVLDPVMVATSGDALLAPEAVDTIVKALFPLARVITPNLAEAQALLGRPVKDTADMELAVKDLARLGAEAVLLKGGHLETNQATDLLYIAAPETLEFFRAPKIETRNTHGTGCTLSAAIATYLALGYELKEAVRKAKEYLSQALEAGSHRNLGRGSGPVDHFYLYRGV